MPRKRPLNQYPVLFAQLMLKGAKAPVYVQCGSRDEAKNLRNQLYTFRSVLRSTDRSLHPYPDLKEAADECQLTIRGATLCCSPRSEHEFDQALRTAIGGKK